MPNLIFSQFVFIDDKPQFLRLLIQDQILTSSKPRKSLVTEKGTSIKLVVYQFFYKFEFILIIIISLNMKVSYLSSENNLLLIKQQIIPHMHSQHNLTYSDTFNRFLRVIYRVTEEPGFSENINQEATPTPKMNLEQDFNIDQEFVEARFQENQMDTENFIEYRAQQPKLKYKTSIENRIPSDALNPEIQPCPLTISVLPTNNQWKMNDCTLRFIDIDNHLNVQHLQSLFKVDDTYIMVFTLAYLVKVSCSKIEFYNQMNTTLRKFAASYLIACKMNAECIEKKVIEDISSVLGLDVDTLLRLQRELLFSMDFHLQLTKQYLDKVAKVLFD